MTSIAMKNIRGFADCTNRLERLAAFRPADYNFGIARHAQSDPRQALAFQKG
jgi:hypothetical protein